MKKNIIVLLFIFTLHGLYANDAWVNAAGGSFASLDGKNQNVQMVSEHIKIDMYENYYEMNIEFLFFNHGNTVELMVGFPEYYYGTTPSNIREFETTINDERIEVEKRQNADQNSGINLWYVKNIVFQANGYTRSTVRYIADYAGAGSYRGVEYLYGTGSSWKDNIESITVEITNHCDFWLNRTWFRTKNVNYIMERKDNKTIIVKTENILPDVTDTFDVDFSVFPAFEHPHFGVSERRWRLRDEIIPIGELSLLKKEQLRILRNSIFAYHGYRFNSVDLRNYFEKQRWYKINENFSENVFSENERINLQNILAEESRRN
jgi:hypothetical protein